MELRVLRARATCTRCGSRLPPRSEAWSEPDGSGVLCDWCHRTSHPPRPIAVDGVRGEALPTPTLPHRPPEPEPAVPATLPRPRIRRSAEAPPAAPPRAEPEPEPPRTAEPEPASAPPRVPEPEPEPVRAAPAVGPLVAELPLADGAAPLAWKGEFFQGPPVPAGPRPMIVVTPGGSQLFSAAVAELAEGRPEPVDRVGAVLRAAEQRGLIWLPKRRTAGGFVIDHLAVTPNGIWVVGAEPSPTGRVDRRDIGDWFTPEPRLYVGDDDHTHAVRRIEGADDSLGRSLQATTLRDVARFKVLCFDDVLPGWLDRPFPFDDVWVTWSRHLVEPMLATADHQPDQVASMARAIDQVLVPAT